MRSTRLFKLLAAAILLCAAAKAQEPASPGGRFQKDGLSFDYPPGWALTDKSGAEVQDVSLTRPGGTAVVRVLAHRAPLRTPELLKPLRETVTDPFVEALARSLGLGKAPGWDKSQCIQLGERFASGFRMSGRVGGLPTTGEVYTIVLGRRFVHLVYVRADREEAAAAPAWKSVLDTLKVEPPANTSADAGEFDNLVMGGLRHGKALKKPQPQYPSEAQLARAEGTVSVKIRVDEEGNVIRAEATSGPHVLRGAAEEAALRAKYSPTLVCGRPVKVTGVITYNFRRMEGY